MVENVSNANKIKEEHNYCLDSSPPLIHDFAFLAFCYPQSNHGLKILNRKLLK